MAMRLEANELGVVFGGSGLVGRHIVRALARDGWRIRAAERRPDLAGFLSTMGVVGQVQPVQANLRFPESLPAVLEGADLVVNAVGVLARSGPQTFQALHVKGARALAKAARAAGVKRFVHISSIGASRKSPSNYARSKAAGEAAVLEEFPEAVILRLSLVFGPEDAFFNRFAKLARISPILPVIGGGRTRFQPVYAGDVGLAAAAAARGIAKPGSIYEIGGPEVTTFKELLAFTTERSGHSPALMPLPFFLARLMALATWPFPNSVRPLTYDQVRLLKVDNVVSGEAAREGRTLKDLGVTSPRTVEAIVPSYLEQYRPRGQFSHYRG